MQLNLPAALVTALVAGFRPLKLARARLDVLRCLSFGVTPGSLTVTGSDLDQHLTYTGPLPTDVTARFLVPADLLAEVAKQADEGIELTRDGDKLSLICSIGGARVVRPIDLLNPEDFPPVPLFPAGQVTPPGFIRSLLEALPSASEDAARYILNGVFVSSTHVAATDGLQLYASNSLSLTLPTGGLILPATDAWKVFSPDEAAELTVRLNGKEPTHAAIRQGSWQWATKLVIGNYPNWAQVVPKANEAATKITFSAEDAVRLQKVLPRLPGHKDHNAPVTLSVDHGFAVLQAGKEGGLVTLDLPTVKTEGPAILCRFNRQFLVQALAHGFRQLSVHDDRSPLIMRDGSRLHLWMPIRMEAPPPAPVPERVAVPNETKTETQPDTPPMQESTAAPAAPVNRLASPAPVNRTEAQAPVVSRVTPAETDPVTEKLQHARELLRQLNGTLGEVLVAVKESARSHRTLERDHEALRKNIRALRAVEV